DEQRRQDLEADPREAGERSRVNMKTDAGGGASMATHMRPTSSVETARSIVKTKRWKSGRKRPTAADGTVWGASMAASRLTRAMRPIIHAERPSARKRPP